jgi:hypothetical protein
MRDTGNMRLSSAATAHAGLRLLATLAVAAAATGLLAARHVALQGDGRPALPAFLGETLGAEHASAPLVRTPERGVEVAVRGAGFGVERKGTAIDLAATGTGTSS